MDGAVALKYPKGAETPLIAAKEKGLLARRMVEIAKENDIPLVQDELLQNVLSVQDIGSCIPENTWQAVASIFAYIAKLEEKRGGR